MKQINVCSCLPNSLSLQGPIKKLHSGSATTQFPTSQNGFNQCPKSQNGSFQIQKYRVEYC